MSHGRVRVIRVSEGAAGRTDYVYLEEFYAPALTSITTNLRLYYAYTLVGLEMSALRTVGDYGTKPARRAALGLTLTFLQSKSPTVT